MKKIIKIKNGDILVNYRIFSCDICNKDIEEAWPRYEKENYHLCIECGFKQNLLSSKEYLRYIGFDIPSVHAGINPSGKIEIWSGKATPPWKRTSKQQRQSPKYAVWRTKVFERDNYTCQNCNQRGGILNAHHIKPFKNYPKLRYEIDNGVTLCEKCHKEVHKKKVIKWLDL